MPSTAFYSRVDCRLPYATPTILDSWSGFRDHSNLLSDVPAGKELKLVTTPPGPLSSSGCVFFRIFKRFTRRVHVLYLHQILTVLPETINSSEIVLLYYKHVLRSAAGYVDTHLGLFSTPAEYAFNKVSLDTYCQGTYNCSPFVTAVVRSCTTLNVLSSDNIFAELCWRSHFCSAI